MSDEGSPPSCYEPALSPMGWCLNRIRCQGDLPSCEYALGKSTELKIVPTEKGAKYPYKVVKR